jgi:hypothetical protein
MSSLFRFITERNRFQEDLTQKFTQTRFDAKNEKSNDQKKYNYNKPHSFLESPGTGRKGFTVSVTQTSTFD